LFPTFYKNSQTRREHIIAYLLGILSTSLSCLTRLGLDVKIDEEKARQEGSEKDSKVGTELNLKGNRVRRKCIDDGVGGEGRCRDDRWSHSNGGLEGSYEIEGKGKVSLRKLT
jgi:hypothetical protein